MWNTISVNFSHAYEDVHYIEDVQYRYIRKQWSICIYTIGLNVLYSYKLCSYMLCKLQVGINIRYIWTYFAAQHYFSNQLVWNFTVLFKLHTYYITEINLLQVCNVIHSYNWHHQFILYSIYIRFLYMCRNVLVDSQCCFVRVRIYESGSLSQSLFEIPIDMQGTMLFHRPPTLITWPRLNKNYGSFAGRRHLQLPGIKHPTQGISIHHPHLKMATSFEHWFERVI